VDPTAGLDAVNRKIPSPCRDSNPALKRGLQMYVEWQGMSIVETRREDKATQHRANTND